MLNYFITALGTLIDYKPKSLSETFSRLPTFEQPKTTRKPMEV